jgi:hypothetical protein
MSFLICGTVELSCLCQLAGLFAPPTALGPYHKPYVRKKHDSKQVCFSEWFYACFCFVYFNQKYNVLVFIFAVAFANGKMYE